MLEAMAAKVPVLSSDIEANKYLIEKKTAGVVFKDEDSKDLKRKINVLHANPELRNNLAHKAYQALIEDFDLTKRTKILESLYLNN
nr:sugar transferase, PEP-CTERM/EpsH1 system associated [Escherichia coli]